MKTDPYRIRIVFWAAMLLTGFSVCAALHVEAGDNARQGVLELECNIAKVDLYLCPRDQFERETKEKFFGLIKSHEDTCSGGQLFLGTTPLKPLAVPAGHYVVILPQGYTWEHEGPVEINIPPDERSFFLLKLFSRNDRSNQTGPGDTPDAGIGSGGAPGTPPP